MLKAFGETGPLKIFSPVSLSRELCAKSLRHSHFALQLSVVGGQNREFPCKIPC
jgi:hypothetical protein